MRTLLIVLVIWLLINALFVVVMIPPRKPRASARWTGPLEPATVRVHDGPPADDPPLLLRHVVIAIALGAFFSLTPPLADGFDALRRWVHRMSGKSADGQEKEEAETLEAILARLRAEQDRTAGNPRPENDDHAPTQR
jgi:hypothetical protein